MYTRETKTGSFHCHPQQCGHIQTSVHRKRLYQSGNFGEVCVHAQDLLQDCNLLGVCKEMDKSVRGGYLEAGSCGDIPDAHSAIHRGAEQPLGVLTHHQPCHSILMPLELAHLPQCLHIIPASSSCLIISICSSAVPPSGQVCGQLLKLPFSGSNIQQLSYVKTSLQQVTTCSQ